MRIPLRQLGLIITGTLLFRRRRRVKATKAAEAANAEAAAAAATVAAAAAAVATAAAADVAAAGTMAGSASSPESSDVVRPGLLVVRCPPSSLVLLRSFAPMHTTYPLRPRHSPSPSHPRWPPPYALFPVVLFAFAWPLPDQERAQRPIAALVGHHVAGTSWVGWTGGFLSFF